MCSVIVNPDEEFAPLDQLHNYRPVIRLLNVSVLFRVSTSAAASSSSKNGASLIGHPRLLQLPSIISSQNLHEAVEGLLPKQAAFELCFVDSQVGFFFFHYFIALLDFTSPTFQGNKCSRCVYPIRCTGCKIDRDADQVLSLQPGDCLAVQQQQLSSAEDSPDASTAWQQLFDVQINDDQESCISNTSCRSKKEPLTLDDCLKAFSERFLFFFF